MADSSRCVFRGWCEAEGGTRGLCAYHYGVARRTGTRHLYPPLGHWGGDPERSAAVGRKISEAKKGKEFTEAHRLALSAAQTGKKRSPEHIRNSVAGKDRATILRIAATARAAKGPTRLELAVRSLLDSMGVEFIEQHPIGVYTVDFYVPKTGLVIEADGAYWHGNVAKERARDAYLLRNPAVSDVVHLPEDKLREWIPAERWDTKYRTAAA